jgi:hypothetical protein
MTAVGRIKDHNCWWRFPRLGMRADGWLQSPKANHLCTYSRPDARYSARPVIAPARPAAVEHVGYVLLDRTRRRSMGNIAIGTAI